LGHNLAVPSLIFISYDTMEAHYRGSHTTTTTRTASPMRPGTPETARNPFGDENASAMPPSNPFTSPYGSRPTSSIGSSSALRGGLSQKYFHSRRVRKGEVDQPWKSNKDPKEKWVTIIPLIGLSLGLALAGFLVYDGISSVVHHNYCPVLSDDFSNGLNTNIWTQEAEVGGFG
jgi:hypothetical protein